jgi:hypothetical protein
MDAPSHLVASTTNAVTVNAELAAKLQSELSMEEDMKEDADLSANIKEYLENSAFEVLPFLKVLYPRLSELIDIRLKISLASRKLSSLEHSATRRSASHSAPPT